LTSCASDERPGRCTSSTSSANGTRPPRADGSDQAGARGGLSRAPLTVKA
jgi:hypothetical protein